MKIPKYIIALFTIILLAASVALGQTNPPPRQSFGTVIGDFFNPTNSFLSAKEISTTAFMAYHRDECVGGGLRMNFWLSDQQGAALSYVMYANDHADWELAYGYRRMFGTKMEMGFFAGGKTAVDEADNGLMRLFTEIDATYKMKAVDLFVGFHFPVEQRPGIRFGVSKSF